jgi:uncharacterized protein (TIGR03118 family)
MNSDSFDGLTRFSGRAGVVSVAMVLLACSSSSNGASSGPDAGPDTSNGTGGKDSGGPSEGGGPGSEAGPVGDGGDGGVTVTFDLVAQTNLVSDLADAGAQLVDPNLTNAWGLAFSGGGTPWVSDNGSDMLSFYPKGDAGLAARSVGVTPPGDAGVAGPSGQIFNAASKATDGGTGLFNGDLFIACTESGTISGWKPADGTTAATEVDESATGAVFKGLAVVPTATPELAVADFHNGVIRLYDTTYAPMTTPANKWVDSTVPAGFAPFNILADGTSVYVAYAKQLGPDNHDDMKGPGNGAVSVFQTDGTLVKSLIPAGAQLDSPWGMAVVPAGGWATLPAGALLVGSFGAGTVWAFDATTGAPLGQLATSSSTPLVIEGLWALGFWANPSDAGASQLLYFTAGPNAENDGLFGYLAPSP